jgi:hypothetical protein
VRESTGTDDFIGQTLDQTLQGVAPRMPDALMETFASFLARNQTSQTLRTDMSLGAPYVLLTDAALGQIFKPGGDPEAGWQAFYSKYPDAHGFITLSRVAFDAAGAQALVYVGSAFDALGGEGTYHLLVRQGDAWVVDQEATTWIS